MDDEFFIPLPRVVKALRTYALISSVIAFILAAPALLGWLLRLPALRDFPGQLPPRTNAALAQTLCSCALFLLVSVKNHRKWRGLIGALSLATALIGGLTLLEHFTGFDLKIDQMLAKDHTQFNGVLSPNRMGPPAAISFLFLGTAIFLQTFRRKTASNIAQTLSLCTALIVLIPLLGYLYGVDDVFMINRYATIAWSASLSLLLLSGAVAVVFPETGFIRYCVADDSGGILLRYAFVPTVVLTIVIGYLRIAGERLGYYDAPMGTALRVLLSIILYGLMIAGLARMLARYAADSRRQKELLSVTLSSIGEGVIVTDSQGQVTFINPEAQRLTGWTQSEATGKPLASVFRIIHEETRQPVESPVEKVLREKTIVTLTNHTLLVNKQGGEIPIDDSGAPVRTPDGRILGVVLDFRDFSEKKAAQQALEQSQKRYHDLVERLPDALCISRDERIIFANAAALNLFGVRPDEIIGHAPEALLSPDDPGIIAQRLAFLGGGQAIDSFSKLLVRDDGQRRHVEITAIPFTDLDGAAIQWVLRDVTERNQTAEALDHAKTAAEQANVAKDHFLAVLSHELRTPLTPALAATSMLMRSPDLKPEQREQAELIFRNIELEARLVDDLLDVTRITQGKIELQRAPVSLHQILRYAAEVCQIDLEKKNIQLITQQTDQPAMILGDATRLQQIFWNLLRNAIKFTAVGGHIEVRSAIDAGGNHVVVEIQDDGVGIDSESLPRLFNAFEQGSTRVTRQFGGLGLGLAISRTMAELHGGTIEADSAGRDKGAVFRVRLPLISGNKAESGTASFAPLVTAPDIIPLRILLVEDHPDTARVMKRLLIADGHKVETASTVAAAIGLVEKQDFDLLLSDLGLPDGTGHDLMRSLRSRGIQLPGIAISGYGQQSDIARSKDVGFAGHLTKPVNPIQLAQSIAEVMTYGV